MKSEIQACIERAQRGGTLGQIARALNDAVLHLRQEVVNAEAAAELLRPISGDDWHGKWRIQKALALLSGSISEEVTEDA